MADSKYSEFLLKREAAQNEIADLFNALENKEFLFIESPTGSGKTHACLKSALLKKKKLSTPVVISTNNNANVKNIRETAKQYFDLNNDEIVVEIGRSSYINITLLAEEVLKDETLCSFLTYDELVDRYFIEEINGERFFNSEVLLDDFCANFGIRENDFYFLPYMQSSGDTIGEKELKTIIKHLESHKIIITNHTYFIILVQYFANQNNSDVESDVKKLFLNAPIILDEFHTLYDSAKSVLSSNFSLFQLKNSLFSLLKNLPEKNTITIKKKLSTLLSKIIDIQEKISISNEKERKDIARSEINQLKVSLGYTNGIERLVKQVQKIKNSLNDEKLSISILQTKKELNELKSIPLTSSKIQIIFSPKQYPSFVLTNSTPMYELKRRVLLKLNSSFLCLSGTMRTELGNDKKSFQWVLQRNGFFKDNIEEVREFLISKNIEEENIAEILHRHSSFNSSLENAQYKKYNSLFEKSNFQFVLFNNSKLFPPKYQYGEEQGYKNEWYDSVSLTISNTLACNSLVLVSSYEDVSNIALRLKRQRRDVFFIQARQGVSLTSIVAQHKNNIEKGNISCIVGSEQFFTGLDLKGDLLKEVFLVKLPFEPPRNNIGTHKFNKFDFTKSENYENRLLFKILQGVGRGNRDFKDKTILYLLDPRVLKSKQTSKVIPFMKEKGMENSYNNAMRYKSNFLGCMNNHDNILLFFSPLYPNISIQEIIHNIKLDLDEVNEANRAINTLMELEYSLEKYGLEDALEDVSGKNYNFWKHLLKIYLICSLRYDKINKTQTALDAANGDLIAYSKSLFLKPIDI